MELLSLERGEQLPKLRVAPDGDASIGWVKRVQIGHIERVANEPVPVRGPSAWAAEVLDLDVLHFRGCPPAAGLGCTSAIDPSRDNDRASHVSLKSARADSQEL
jgi:hypothetical protein